MVGGVIGGYSETGRRNTATPPSKIITKAMTFASTGRSMKNLANMTTPGPGSGLDRLGIVFDGHDLVPGARVQESIYDYTIRRGKSAANGATVGSKRPFHDGTARDDVIGFDDKDVISLLIVTNCAVGNNQHRLRLAQWDTNSRE